MKGVAQTLLVALLTLGLAGQALAQTEELRSTSVVPPDSPVFFIQRVLDSWEEFLAFAEIDEAKVQAKIARNRLAEAAAMLRAGRAELAAALSGEMAERTERAAAELAKAKARADEARKSADDAKARGDEGRARGQEAEANAKQEAIDRVLAQLAENDQKRQEGLQSALDKVENERAREAIQMAMERSKKGLETAAKNVGKDVPSNERRAPDATRAPAFTGPTPGVPGGGPAGVPPGRPETATQAPPPAAAPTTAPRPAGSPAATQAPTTTGAPTSAPAGRPTSAPAGRP